MTKHISVPVDVDLFLSLVDFLRSKSDSREPVEVISTAIEYWLDSASWKPELLTESSTRGYQWKSLFLPEGTEIRMQYKGAYSYAKVEGDEIIYNGKSISPGSLANTIASSSRNAWKDLWVKRPDDKEWRLADDCRNEQNDTA
ncbi:hypothetical protein OKW41_006149 [Paraburkholderia sp. UCT70]|uniref:hypothetical protein n=1 Tax=Paraburkholderia sp. UCT70 TaxID=2991068 RepID=UPI003D206D9C